MPLVVMFLGVILLFGPPLWVLGIALIVIGTLWAVLQ
jgi:hypothetical protein